MKNILKVSLSDNNENEYYLKNYGKLNGWWLCSRYSLPTFTELYIVVGEINPFDNELLQIFGETPLLCRTDAPFGKGASLPRGRNLSINNINEFLLELKSKCKESIILMCKNPSIQLTGKELQRYETGGGIMIIFEKYNQVIVELVGKGFDVGDITRGKAVHSSIVIPWNMILENPIKIFKHCIYIEKNRYFLIGTQDYLCSRETRINELVKNLKEENIIAIDNAIPLEASKITLSLFEKIYYECIEKIAVKQDEIEEPFGIMLNMYEGQFCIFEVWQMRRSIPIELLYKY